MLQRKKQITKARPPRLLAAAAAALLLLVSVSCARTEKASPGETTVPAASAAATSSVQTTAPAETAAAQSTVPEPAATAAEPSTTSAAPAAPASKAEIVAFLAAAVNDIKNNRSASYDKVEYQIIHEVNMTGNGTVDRMISDSIGSFAKNEKTAERLKAEKGAPSSGENMPGWNLADDAAVVSAALSEEGGRYRVAVVMADEDIAAGSAPGHLEAMGSVMRPADIEAALQSVPQMKEFRDIHILYTGYTVSAELTPEGRLLSLRHQSNVEIRIGHMKILVLSLDNKSISLENVVEYSDFVY